MSEVTTYHAGQPFGLTPREKEVVGLIVDGLSNTEIAAVLFVSVETVRSHRISIRAKMDCRNGVEIAVRWLREVEYAVVAA